MMPRARDVMETAIVSVGPDTPLIDVHRLLTEEEISGAPVVDDEGALLGVITATDLLRAVTEEHEASRADTNYFRDLLPYSSPDWLSAPEDFQDRLSELRAEDAMTREVLTISPDASVALVARELRARHFHRVFVAERDRLVGVVSAFDLLKVVEELKD
jgi:CBS domain-containing protein